MEINIPSDEKELSYDLRQTYATIVGEHMQDVAGARKRDNYPLWFKSLNDLFIIVKHKFSKDEDNGKFIKLQENAIKIANECRNTWLGSGKDEEETARIEKVLAEIEMFLYEKMDDAKMFGAKFSDEGL